MVPAKAHEAALLRGALSCRVKGILQNQWVIVLDPQKGKRAVREVWTRDGKEPLSHGTAAKQWHIFLLMSAG